MPQRSKKLLDRTGTLGVAYDLLSRKAWTRQELLLRLRRRGASMMIAEDVVKKFEELGLIDDRAFADAWAEGRARHRHLGKRRLRQELTLKGVSRPEIDAALLKAFGAEGEATEAGLAAAGKWQELEKRDPDKAPRRLRDYLLRRGFPSELVERAVRECARLDT
jgi:regulatory protein